MVHHTFDTNMVFITVFGLLEVFCWIIGAHGRCDRQSGCARTPEDVDFKLQNARTEVLHGLLENYDSLIRPHSGKGETTNVTCDIFINNVDSVNVDSMDFSVDIYMRQSWHDPRLAFHDKYNFSRISLDAKLIKMIWVPDIFFPNEKEAHDHCVTVPNRLVRVYSDGTVFYSARYSLTLSCHMSLTRFPLDNQNCWMKLESYGYTDDEIRLAWKEIDPVQVNPDLELPQFQLTKWGVDDCTTSYITGSFACLKVSFYLERQYGYFIVQNYIPSMLIVVLSWVAFWINIDAVPARISVGVLTVLTMTTQSVGVWMSLPRVSYIKAIDVWMSVAVMFVFLAMLEFAVVNTLARKEIRRLSLKIKNTQNEEDIPSDMIKRIHDEYTYGSTKRYDPNSRQLARKVDKIARKIFPSAFIMFNIFYWTCYLLVPLPIS